MPRSVIECREIGNSISDECLNANIHTRTHVHARAYTWIHVHTHAYTWSEPSKDGSRSESVVRYLVTVRVDVRLALASTNGTVIGGHRWS